MITITITFPFWAMINDYTRDYNVIVIDYDYAITITIVPKSASVWKYFIQTFGFIVSFYYFLIKPNETID